MASSLSASPVFGSVANLPPLPSLPRFLFFPEYFCEIYSSSLVPLQLLGGAAATTGDSQSGHGGGSMPSPLSGTNEASLSPSGGSTATGITGPVSPGAISQSSNNAIGGTGVSGTSPTDPDAVGNDVSGATEADAVVGGGGASALEAHVRLAANGMSCCENGRPIITDPVSGQTVCSCQYDASARLTLGGYSRMPIPSAGVGVYGGPYPSNEQNPYPSIGVDNSAFYSPLVSEAFRHWRLG